MKRTLRAIAALLALILALSACGQAPAVETAIHSTSEAPTDPPVAEEYTEPIPEGYNQVVFYWNYPGSYETCDMWIWFPQKDGKGYTFHECEYGGKVIVNVPEGVEEVGFIVRRDCSDPGGSSWGSATKDYEQDRYAVVTGKQTVIYLKTGDASQYKSNDGGKTLDMTKKINIVGIADANVLEYKISPKTTITNLSQVKVTLDGQEVAIANISTLGKEAASGSIELVEALDLSGNYTVSIEGYGEQVAVPTSIFDSQFFADNYHYEGTDLGAVIQGENTTFKVWAPTASKVVLNLFTAGDGVEAYKTVEMVKGEKGVWAHTEACGHGTYYT